MNQTKRIYEFVHDADAPPTMPEVAAALDISKTVTGEALRDLTKRRLVVHVPVTRSTNKGPMWGYVATLRVPTFRRPRGEPAKAAIQLLSERGAMVTSDIAKVLDLPLTHTAHVMNRLERKGVVKSTRREDVKRKPREYALVPLMESAQ
jgi:Mn-dependent DtxR family transcriptional regulator